MAYFAHLLFCADLMTALRLITLLIVASTLTACSRGPSEQDISTAYQKEVAQTNAMTSKLGGKALEIKVNEVKKIDCKENGDTGQYRCQVEVDTTVPFVGQHREATELTLSKGEQGWSILRGSAQL